MNEQQTSVPDFSLGADDWAEIFRSGMHQALLEIETHPAAHVIARVLAGMAQAADEIAEARWATGEDQP